MNFATATYRFNRVLNLIGSATTLLLLVSQVSMAQPPTGKQAGAGKQAIPTAKQPALTDAQRALMAKQLEWHKSMINAPVPHSGCFKAEYPRLAWQEVQCSTPPNIPMPPKHGPQPFTVGNGYDYSAQVSGQLLSVIGSFDTMSTTGESGFNFNSQTTAVTDSYTLQVNSNFFASPPACNGATNPASCQGWQQYVYSSKSAGAAYIQYWLLSYGNTCPSGWNSYSGDCYRNSSSSIAVPLIPATSLAQVSLTGSVTAGGNDRLDLSDGSTHYAITSPDNIVSLANYWTEAEFAVVGDCCGFSANFNANSSIAVRATVHNGTTSAPACIVAGFTGETNNLNLVSTPMIGTQTAPTLISDQTSASATPASCAVASGVGDIHIHTFTPTPQVNAPASNLNYDFQAAGDFILAKTDDGFEVQTRQISGAPTWPNATLNHAIAAKIGNSVVVVSVANSSPQLIVNGSIVTLNDSQVHVLNNEGDIVRHANTYVVRDLNGNSVEAIVQSAAMNYIDVYVGLGRWPTNVQGLLANAKGNINAVTARSGATFPAPFNFSTFYSAYGDSWRVTANESLFNTAASHLGEVISSNPTEPFNASQLAKATYNAAKSQCQTAGVKTGALDDCILDVAVVGDKKAALSYVRPQFSIVNQRATIFALEDALPQHPNN